MTPAQLLQLVLLAAIWGSSFMFMRIAVPQLGPSWLLELRLLSASLVLLLVSRLLRKPLMVRRYWRHYLILGLFNTALPFFAFAYAAQTLPASMLAILNSTAPLWGVLIGVIWRGKPITGRAVLGLMLGMGGGCLAGGTRRAAGAARRDARGRAHGQRGNLLWHSQQLCRVRGKSRNLCQRPRQPLGGNASAVAHFCPSHPYPSAGLPAR
jgi:drug/metabolite transporter (DMT)-like permease